MTSTYCDLLFVKWAVNSGGIMLRHPVLWQFVSAPFPTKAVVKSHHMISRGDETKCLFLCRFFLPRLWRTSHVGIFTSGVSFGGSYWVRRLQQRFWYKDHRAVWFCDLKTNSDGEEVKEQSLTIGQTKKQTKTGNNKSGFYRTGWGNPRSHTHISLYLLFSNCVQSHINSQGPNSAEGFCFYIPYKEVE